MYRYVIYIFIFCLLQLYNILYLRRKGKDSYTIDILSLSIIIVLFTYEAVYIYTTIITLIAISIQILFNNVSRKKSKVVKDNKIKKLKVPIGFYMCVSNILVLLISNFAIFYR